MRCSVRHFLLFQILEQEICKMAASDQLAKKLNKNVFPKNVCSVGEIITPGRTDVCLRIDAPINPKPAAEKAADFTISGRILKSRKETKPL